MHARGPKPLGKEFAGLKSPAQNEAELMYREPRLREGRFVARDLYGGT
jgi:hypothetical protein